MNNDTDIKVRLEQLRFIFRSERMSYGELAELQGLAEFIDPGDMELLEAAGVPEFPDQLDVSRLDATITFDNGQTVQFAITREGIISRWGADNEILGAIVDLTEDVRRSLFDHLSVQTKRSGD